MSKTAQTSLERFASDPLLLFNSLVIPSTHGDQRFANCIAPFQRERFEQIAPAWLAVAHGKRPPIGNYWWEATKGGSKDSDLALCIVWLLLVTARPLTIQVAAADADQADEIRKAIRDLLRLNTWLTRFIEVQRSEIRAKQSGGVCKIIPADVAGSHGARPDVLICNELSHVTKQEFCENLMDNATKVPRGLVVIATNAGQVGQWQWQWQGVARRSERWVFNKYAQPAPWLDPDDIEDARVRNTASRFNRLYHGVWSTGGDALEPEDIDAAVDSDLRPMEGTHRDYEFLAGLDLSVKHDHSALIVLACHGKTQRIRVADILKWAPGKRGRVDLEAVEAAVIEADRKFRLTACLYDPYQAALMAQRLQRRNVIMREMTFVGKNLDLMASTLLDTFRSRRIDLFPDDRIVSDLRRLSIVEKSYGYKLESTRDATGHADVATALAIALPEAVGIIRRNTGQQIILARTPAAERSDDLRGWKAQNFF